MNFEDVIETLALRAANRFVNRIELPWMMNEEDVVYAKAFGHDVDAVHFEFVSNYVSSPYNQVLAQAKAIENYQAVNNALQAYLIGSYALDKVSKPNHAKARDLFDYSFNTLSSVHAEIVQLSPKLDTPITRFMSSLKKEIKDLNDIIEPR